MGAVQATCCAEGAAACNGPPAELPLPGHLAAAERAISRQGLALGPPPAAPLHHSPAKGTHRQVPSVAFIEGMGSSGEPQVPGVKAGHQPKGAVVRQAARDGVSTT